MNQGPDESVAPGQCPLCLAAVPVPPEPRTIGDVVAVLSVHFAHACAAIAVVPPQRPAQLVHP